MAGGDGTIDSVTGVMVDSSAIPSIIPTGTRNLGPLFRNMGEYLNVQEKDYLLDLEN